MGSTRLFIWIHVHHIASKTVKANNFPFNLLNCNKCCDRSKCDGFTSSKTSWILQNPSCPSWSIVHVLNTAVHSTSSCISFGAQCDRCAQPKQKSKWLIRQIWISGSSSRMMSSLFFFLMNNSYCAYLIWFFFNRSVS